MIFRTDIFETVKTWIEQQKLFASDGQQYDRFGTSVALSADMNTLAIGADHADVDGFTDAGAVYVFTRSGDTWTEQAKLVAPVKGNQYYFGRSVSLSGDGNTLAVGSPFDSSGSTNNGVAYVFTRSGSTWSLQAQLNAPTLGMGDSFGQSVSLSGDGNTLAVGAYGRDLGYNGTGAVYMFTRSGSTWTRKAELAASDRQAFWLFGHSVDLSPDANTLVVGAYGANNYSGAAYVFVKSGSTWIQQTRLMPVPGAVDADYFGVSVAISDDGNTAVVGSYQVDVDGFTDAGAVYVFTRSGSTWSQQTRLTASDKANYDKFGTSVSISGDGNTVTIGSPYADSDGVSSTGNVYVFTRSDSTWTEKKILRASDKDSGDRLGMSVTISPDASMIVSGAVYADTNVADSAGAAYVFQLQ